MEAGVYSASLTPLQADLSCDEEELVRHCHDLLRRGCQGVVLFGTTGEGPSFTVEERKKSFKKVIDSGISPDSLVLSVSCNAIDDAVALTRFSLSVGCPKVLMTPPYFFKAVPEDGVIAFYREVIKRVDDPRLAVILYHIPQFTGVPITMGIIRALREEFPKVIVGLKESENNLPFTEQMLAAFPGFKVFVGSEDTILRARQLGAAGTICGLANFCPELICALYRCEGSAQKRIEAVISEIRKSKPFPAIKATLEAQKGQRWHLMRPPQIPLSDKERTDLFAKVKSYL